MGMFDNVNVHVDGCQDYASTLKRYGTVVLKPNIVDNRNILTQSMLSKENTKYVIKWDYEIKEEITVPQNCLIEFDGGSISGGTLIGQNTRLIYDLAKESVIRGTNMQGTFIYSSLGVDADEVDLTSQNGKMELKDKDYDPESYSGLGRVYLRNNYGNTSLENQWMFKKGTDEIVYLMYRYNGVDYNIYDSTTEKGLVLENNIVQETNNYNVNNLPESAREHSMSYGEVNTGYVVTLPDNSTITSNVLNQTEMYPYTTPTAAVGANILTQEMVEKANTVYIIQYDFDLNGETITVPSGSVLRFEGGTLNNGTLNGTYTTIIDSNQRGEENILINVTKTGTWKEVASETIHEQGEEIAGLDEIVGDRNASSITPSHMGRVTLPTQVIDAAYWALYTLTEYNQKMLVQVTANGDIWIPFDEHDMLVLVQDDGESFTDLEIQDVRDISEISTNYLQFDLTSDIIVIPGSPDVKISDLGAAMGRGEITDYTGEVKKANILTQSMINKPNTIYVIQYDFDLNGRTITVPENCVLKFEGGSLKNGTIDFNNCGIEAPVGSTIFGETLNIRGIKYVHASWIGIVPATSGSDSGSSKFVHFCSSAYCKGFELEFDKGEYRFAFHGVLLNKFMKIKGAPQKSTQWFVQIDGSCNYVIGVNRHCSISNLDIRLASRNNQTGVDFFRVSNEWSDNEDAADSMKVNYDYYFDTVWLKGAYEQDGDYSSSMNGIAIRIRDKQVGSAVLNKVLFAEGPQHCENIMLEMVRAGIVFEVYSEVVDVAWANGFAFNNIFVQGHIGYESIVNEHGSSGKNYISNFQYQGSPNTDGLYGTFNGDFIVNHQSHDTYKFGTANGNLYMSNCNFSDSGSEPYTDLVNGFKKYNDVYPRVLIIPYKVNKLYLTPTTYIPSEGVMRHDVDYSENYKRSWKTRTDQQQKVEEYLDSQQHYKKVNITNYYLQKLFNAGGEKAFIHYSGTNVNRLVDWKEIPTGYSNYQDGAFIKAYTDYGFKLSISRLSSESLNIGDVLLFTYTFELVSGTSGTMSDKLLYIKNLFCTAGEINQSTITKTSTSIVLTGVIKVKHTGSMSNDGIGLEYKILEPANSLTDESQSLWVQKKYTESLNIEFLYHSFGASDVRPTRGQYPGLQYYDTTIKQPIFWNSTIWANADGINVTGVNGSLVGGNQDMHTLEATLSAVNNGLRYFNTYLNKWYTFNGSTGHMRFEDEKGYYPGVHMDTTEIRTGLTANLGIYDQGYDFYDTDDNNIYYFGYTDNTHATKCWRSATLEIEH